MQIDWWTLALQTVNFLVLVWLLTHFLYKPVKNVLDQRRRLAEDAFSKAAQREAEADAVRQRLEDDRSELSRQRQDMLRQAHEDLEAERQTVLRQARSEADHLLADARENLARERQDALASLRQQAADLAVELAARLLRNGEFHSEEATLRTIQQRLNELPADRRSRLWEDLRAPGGRMVVVTARELKGEMRKRWGESLKHCLKSEAPTEFRVDPDLLGGAELRLPHGNLDLSWRNQLARAREWIGESHEPQ